MAIYEKAKIFSKGEIKEGVSASGRPWARMEVVFEIPSGNYTRKLVGSVSNEDVTAVASWPMGKLVEIGYIVAAREWNGKYFNTVDITSIKELGENRTAPTPSAAPQPQAPAEAVKKEGEGDLPF